MTLGSPNSGTPPQVHQRASARLPCGTSTAVPPPPQLGQAWARAEAEAFNRLVQIHNELSEQAATWWRLLVANDESTVCEAVNIAFADNPAAGCAAALRIACPSAAWTIPAPVDPQIRAMILAEIYRRTINGQPTWTLRAVGQGWADGLSALARDYGVNID